MPVRPTAEKIIPFPESRGQPENRGILSCRYRPALSDGSIDPGRPFSQGHQAMYDTNSRKTGTVVLRNPSYAVRLAGIGIQRAPKNHQIALIGGTISGWIGVYYSGHGKTGVFPRSSGSVIPDGPSLNRKNPRFNPPIGVCSRRALTEISGRGVSDNQGGQLRRA